jgi:cytochrome c-type biogenesis protein CcmH/NrfG
VGKLDDARTEYRKVVELQPKFTTAARELAALSGPGGRLAADRQPPDLTIDQLKEVVRQQPRNASAHVALGRAYVADRKETEAAKAFAKAIEVDAGLLPAHEGLAAIALRQGKLEEAVQRLSNGLKVNPNHVELNAKVGDVYARQGRLDKARTHLEAAARVNADLPGVNLLLAEIYLAQRRPDDAMAKALGVLKVNWFFI